MKLPPKKTVFYQFSTYLVSVKVRLTWYRKINTSATANDLYKVIKFYVQTRYLSGVCATSDINVAYKIKSIPNKNNKKSKENVEFKSCLPWRVRV